MDENESLDATRATTVGELMDMAAELNVAFEAKLGKKPASGFNVEINNFSPQRVRIWGGYESFAPGSGGPVVSSTEYLGRTPQEVFECAMAKIHAYKVTSNEDKIATLEAEIAKLRGTLPTTEGKDT